MISERSALIVCSKPVKRSVSLSFRLVPSVMAKLSIAAWASSSGMRREEILRTRSAISDCSSHRLSSFRISGPAQIMLAEIEGTLR
jgi:hypothetical protein